MRAVWEEATCVRRVLSGKSCTDGAVDGSLENQASDQGLSILAG